MNNSWWTYVISVVVVISFLALFAGIYWRKKHHHRQDFNKQISRLVKNYHHFRLQKKFLKPLRLTITNNPHEIPFVKTKINIYPFTLQKRPAPSYVAKIPVLDLIDHKGLLAMEGEAPLWKGSCVLTKTHLFMLGKKPNVIELAKIKQYYFIPYKFTIALIITLFNNDQLIIETGEQELYYYLLFFGLNIKND